MKQKEAFSAELVAVSRASDLRLEQVVEAAEAADADSEAARYCLKTAQPP